MIYKEIKNKMKYTLLYEGMTSKSILFAMIGLISKF